MENTTFSMTRSAIGCDYLGAANINVFFFFNDFYHTGVTFASITKSINYAVQFSHNLVCNSYTGRWLTSTFLTGLDLTGFCQ